MALSNLSAWNTEKAGSPPGPFTGDPILHPAVRRLDAENERGAP